MANVRLQVPLGLLGLGWLFNLAAIIPNGAMPVSMQALESSGMSSTASVEQGHFGKHVRATRSTAVAWLGDVIPAPASTALSASVIW